MGSALERAFQLARSGAAANIGDLRDKLRREDDGPATMKGPLLRAQLRKLIKEAPEKKGGPKPP
ncbi:MAG: hypothetical protein JO051_17915 [Acidobacteriaceae bacterium]|nr:hypothetical protein [Acidobacteriaceae bacterium]